MCDIKMKLGYERSTVEISCLFVDHYMTGCLPVYPLIYIWSLRRLLGGQATTIQEIGERFQLTEGDVIKAWRHWESLGLVSVSASKDEMGVTFLPVKMPEPAADTMPQAEAQGPKPAVSARALETRPQYTAQELACYRSQSRDIERLFARAETTLGKLLSYNDMNVIFGFYDWLRLPIDVIEYLLSYCADNDHRNLRYIEKCALDWADNGICDLERALVYVQSFDRGYRTILRHMGQISGYPTPSHRKYMDKWLHQWHMPIELIIEACDRSVAQIDKPKFSYVDKILAEWHKKGVVTMEGVKLADAEFARGGKPAAKAGSAASVTKLKPNRFTNFNQRENDYAHYEQLERAYLARKLEPV